MSEHRRVVLVDLPNEVLLNIANRVDLKGCRALREVCKHLSWIATPLLFQCVALTPCRGSAARLQHILKSHTLGQQIKHAILRCDSHEFTDELVTDFPDEFSSESDFGLDEDNDTEAEAPHEIEDCLEQAITQRSLKFGEAIQILDSAPNLKHITMTFSRECADPEDTPWRWYEDLDVRRLFMTRLFDLLGGTHISALSISNMHGLADETISGHDAFSLALSRLEEFHIEITHPEDQAYSESQRQLSAFDTWLFDKWVGPLSATLSRMTLYKRHIWGCFPSLFDANIYFPRLTYLSLGYYTIAHNDQIDWILGIGTLKILRLHECKICFSVLIGDVKQRELGLSTEDWCEIPLDSTRARNYSHYLGASERAHLYDYTGTWADHFKRLRDGLQLTGFAFTFNESFWDHLVDCQYDLRKTKFPLSPVRYAVFDGLRNEWPWHTYPREGGLCHWRHIQNPHESRQAADEAALKDLIEAVRARYSRSLNP